MGDLFKPRWGPAEIEILHELFPGAEWGIIRSAIPGHTKGAIKQFARALGVKRNINNRPRWTPAEISTLWRLYPAASPGDLEAALPRHGTLATIGKKASELGIKRHATRTNTRWVHPIIRELRAEREKRKMSRKKLSAISGYHVNQILGWELGQTNPDLRYIGEWAEALGLEFILRKKITGDIVPWPERARLMAGR